MNSGQIIEFTLILLAGCGMPLLASAAVTICIGILQAATQVQEQTTLFLARLTTLSITLWVISPWLSERIVQFFVDILVTAGRSGLNG
jgi:type III secretory pathway component EscS